MFYSHKQEVDHYDASLKAFLGFFPLYKSVILLLRTGCITLMRSTLGLENILEALTNTRPRIHKRI